MHARDEARMRPWRITVRPLQLFRVKPLTEIRVGFHEAHHAGIRNAHAPVSTRSGAS